MTETDAPAVERPLRVLLVEDSEDDAELVQIVLREGGLFVETRVVASETEFRRALDEVHPDLILSDWGLPDFSGGAAVRIAHEWDSTVPCILVSGTIGEELVVEALRAGATDYVVKQRLEALVPAIRRALAEVADHRDRTRLEGELTSAHAAMRGSLDAMADPFLICVSERRPADAALGFRVLFANRAAASFMGVSQDSLSGASIPGGMARIGDRSLLEVAREVVETGRRFVDQDVELQPRGGDGARVRVVSIEIAPFGEGFFATWRDVTEHRETELEMRRLAAAIEQSTEAVVITDAVGLIEYVNSAFERISGYTRAEALGQSPRILRSGLHDSAFYAAMWASLASGHPFVGDLTNRRKDGSLFLEATVISPVRARSGAITSYVSVSRDVTQERASEAARDRRVRERLLIAKALADLKVLPTAAATAHLICRQVGGLTGIVSAVLYIFTSDGSALPIACVRADEAPVTLRRLPVARSRRLLERAEAGPWVEDWRRITSHAYGRAFAGLDVRAVGYTPIRHGRRLIGLLAIGSAEEDALSQLVDSLPALLEFAGFAGALLGPAVADLAESGLIRTRIEEIVRDATFRPVFQPIVDLATGETIGYEALTRFSSGVAPDLVFAEARAVGLEAELERATLAVAIAEAAALPRGAWLSLNVSPELATGDESLAGILERSSHPIVLEITEHALVGDYPALRNAIGRLRPRVRIAVDDAGAGVANFGHIVDLRPAFVKLDIGLVRGIDTDPTRRALMVGLLHFASESASQTIAEGVETEAELATLRELGVPLAQGYLLGRPAPAAEWADRMDAPTVRGLWDDAGALKSGAPAETRDDEVDGPDAIAPVSSDTADAGRGHVDPDLARTERLVAVGRFAGGIAHDFNNVLAAIRMYADLARDGIPFGDPAHADLDQVLASAERAAAITRTLLAFTRREVLAPADVDPADAIADLMPILVSLMGDDVRIGLDIETPHGSVHADPTQLDQVLVNLAVNARDAMPTGGALTIAVHDVASTGRHPGMDPGPSVRISVSDTGIGMDAATRDRIFDPFYTTKDLGKGTGLGLWTVARIVAETGGRIGVETALGQGTTFHVDLPRVTSTRKHKRRRVAAKAVGQRSGGVIVVDDDEGIKQLSQRSLEAVGYTVYAAANADEALQAAERWAGQIDVLVTDVAMPGLPGPELAALIRATQPDIGVVFISGNAEESVTRNGRAGGTWAFLPKPFSVEELRAAVGRARDASVLARERRSPKG